MFKSIVLKVRNTKYGGILCNQRLFLSEHWSCKKIKIGYKVCFYENFFESITRYSTLSVAMQREIKLVAEYFAGFGNRKIKSIQLQFCNVILHAKENFKQRFT